MRGAYFIRGTRVCYEGRINRYGIIYILSRNKPDPIPEKDHSDTEMGVLPGLGLWSPTFLKYRKRGTYKARIEGISIVISDKKDIVVATVIPKDIQTVSDCAKYVVLKNGYLIRVPIDQDDREFNKAYREALTLADQNKKPPLFDNSPFVKISPDFAGRKMILLELGFSDRHKKVFTIRGQEVPCQVKFPLSYRRWGIKPPSIRKNPRSIPGILKIYTWDS